MSRHKCLMGTLWNYLDRNYLILKDEMAEREGFEPSVSLTPHTLSRRAPSAARPSLRRKGNKSLTDKTVLNQLARTIYLPVKNS